MNSTVVDYRKWSKWEWLALITACSLSLVLVTYPIFDFDMFWHLANGREMVSSGRIVSEEIFSYTHPGEHFSNHEWLAQVVFYLLWNAFGAYGLFSLKLFLAGMVSLLLFLTLRNEQQTAGVALLLTVLAVLAGLDRYHERPELFSLFNIALLSFTLLGFRSQQLPRKLLWIVPVVMVTWDWLHGAVFGLGFLTLFVVGENAKHRISLLHHQSKLSTDDLKYLNKCFGLTLLFMLLNPFGLSSYSIFVGYVVGEANFNSVIDEFLPISWEDSKVFIIMCTGTALLALRHWRRLDFTQLLIAVVFTAAAIRFYRIGAVAAIVIVPFIASLLRLSIEDATRAIGRKFYTGSLATTAVLMVLYAVTVKFIPDPPEPDADQYHYIKVYDLSYGYQVDESIYPVGAVNFIQENHLTGHLYNSGNFGGYLSYKITPERKIFQYNMGRVFGDPLYYVGHPDELEQWDIEYAIVGTAEELGALFPPEKWAIVYHDEGSVLVVRRNEKNAALIAHHEIHFFNPVLSANSLLELSHDPEVLPILAAEMGDYLDYREDKRIANVWATILAEHDELRSDRHIQQLLNHAIKYNPDKRLKAMLDHA